MAKGGTTQLRGVKLRGRTQARKRKATRRETLQDRSLERELLQELKENRKRLKRLGHIERYTLMEHPGRLILFRLVLGIVSGFGSVLGATILVAVVVWILSWFQVPAQVIRALGF